MSITLAELGAIGELLGGLAVIISLVYVGLQIRQSADASRAATSQAFAKQYSDLNKLIANPELSATNWQSAERGTARLSAGQSPLNKVLGFWSWYHRLTHCARSSRSDSILSPKADSLFVRSRRTHYLRLFTARVKTRFTHSNSNGTSIIGLTSSLILEAPTSTLNRI